MDNNFKDISGQRFGMLTVTSEYEARRDKNGKSYIYWKCICDCGREIWTRGTTLRYGTVKSCNHHNKCNLKHGMVNSRLYRIYYDMKQRCLNPKNTAYEYYGGRGITICDEWLGENGFINFSKWALSNGYDDELTIDRINTNGNYGPDNCRWADIHTQMMNRRNSLFIEHNGKSEAIMDIAQRHSLSTTTVKRRIDKGWDEKDIVLETPKERKVYYEGKYYSLKELAQKTGISYNTLQSRYNKNFTDEEMVRPLLASLKKAVRQFTLEGRFVSEYESAADASRITGIRKSGIIMCCNHQRKTCGGFKWEHANEKNIKRKERCLRRKTNGGWKNDIEEVDI